MNWLIGDTREAAKRGDFLLPADRTQAVLERERKRADRSGDEFSLIVLSPTSRDSVEEHVAELARQLEARLRTTDVAGFLDAHRIGVMLPGTSGDEAWNVAASIPLASKDGGRPFRVEVFGYPSHHPPEEGGPPTSGGDRRERKQPRTAGGEARPGASISAIATAVADENPVRVERPVLALETLFVQPIPLWKRTVDIAGALFGLIALSPLLIATAALIKLTSPGPIFFRQLRDGLGGAPFTIYKFRTMYLDAEARKAELRKFSEQDGPAFKMTNDPRITPLGRFLRKTCIDELPQFWNVLKGDMSLVGPRPLDCKEARHITGWGRRRLEVTPGLTCIWQVHGKSKVTFTEWMRMDCRYLKGRSFFRDMKLVFETVMQVLRRRGSV